MKWELWLAFVHADNEDQEGGGPVVWLAIWVQDSEWPVLLCLATEGVGQGMSLKKLYQAG